MKPKDAPSLFELVHREPVLPPPVDAPLVTEAFEYHTPAPPPPTEPWIREEGNRIRFSLTTVGLAVAIVSLGMVIIGAFALGRNTGRASGPTMADGPANDDEHLRLLQAQAPDPTVLEDIEAAQRQWDAEQKSAPEPTAVPPSTDGWVRGLNYIWIDTFATAGDAELAQGFLSEAGVGSTVVYFDDIRKWRLITPNGYDYGVPDDKATCLRLAERIERLGDTYSKQGGRYRFRCQVTKLIDQW